MQTYTLHSSLTFLVTKSIAAMLPTVARARTTATDGYFHGNV